MSVVSATASDLMGILALEAEFAERERWSEQLWQDELSGSGRRVIVVRDGDRIVGAGTFQLVADVADLNRIVVASSHRRRGLAASLLADGIAWARAGGASRMLLEVRRDNPAIDFYVHCGFSRIARRDDYYAPGAHAVVMELALEGEAA